jgi:hypothetical protein
MTLFFIGASQGLDGLVCPDIALCGATCNTVLVPLDGPIGTDLMLFSYSVVLDNIRRKEKCYGLSA